MSFSKLNRIHPKLLMMMMTCSLAPLVLACLLLTALTNRALISQAAIHLQDTHNIHLDKIEEFFQIILDDNRLLAESPDTETFLTRLLTWRDSEKRGGSRLDFHGPSYQSIIANQQQLWAKWLGHHHFHDLYLADTEGLLLFAEAGGEELGTNLHQGRLSASGLATAWRRGKEADTPVLIDFSSFAADGGRQAAFIAYPVRGEGRGLLGVLICRLALETVSEEIRARGEKLGQTGESYLVGQLDSGQFQFRSDIKNIKGNTVGISPDFHPAYWQMAAANGKSGGSGRFRDLRDHDVLTAFNQLNIPDVRWYLISKIDVEEITAPVDRMAKTIALASLILVALIIAVTHAVAKTITDNILEGIGFAQKIAKGDYNAPLRLTQRDEFGDLTRALHDMAEKLRQIDWLQSGRNQLNELLRDQCGSKELATVCLDFFVEYLGASMGALYLFENGIYQRAAAYAFHDPDGKARRFVIGDGLVGEAGKRNKLLTRDIPDGTPLVHVGMGVIAPRYCLACPFSCQGAAIGVLFLGLPEKTLPYQEHFLEQSHTGLGGAFNNAQTQERLSRLMETSKKQQRELARSLVELEEKNRDLEGQREEMEATNLRLATAQKIVQQRAHDLETANRRKGEFLATMSHELRTPLNSIIILSKILSENRGGALSEQDIELANTIHTSGQSLLRLINEVLDISKIDAGKMTMTIEDCNLDDLLTNLDRMFRGMAEGKNLRFFIERAPDLPVSLRTDGHRLQQILINLLNNACKFTERGEISLTVSHASHALFDENNPFISDAVAFVVADSGIGIAKSKQQTIFKAFRQAENGISRKYGGTGLGLAICRRMAKLLGGFIHLESAPGKGSAFTLIVPESLEGYVGDDLSQDEVEAIAVTAPPEDDRGQLEAGSKAILHIESDLISARLIRDFAHKYGFQYLLASSCEEGLKMARFHRPRAILLNAAPSDMDGKEALRRLQAEAELAVIPVFLSMSAERGDRTAEAKRLGAAGSLSNLATPTQIEAMFITLRHLIDQQTPVLGLISDDGDFPLQENAAAHIEKIAAPEALAAAIEGTTFDCLLAVATNPRATLPTIISQLVALETPPPLIIFVKNGLDAETEALIASIPHLAALATTDEREVLRLLAIFLHRAVFYPTAVANGLTSLSEQAPPRSPLSGHTVLLGDGDLRHTFALSSALESLGIQVVIARDGEECLEKLKTETIDAVLLNIHLPKQDGLMTLTAIRAGERFARLPVILCGNDNDRDACQATSASGFLVKPVFPEKLLELLSSEL